MDRKSPPERSPTDPPDMATMVMPQNIHATAAGVNKRYRPTPAKTFQCRGFGDCRMVFSRSEHLARHIRKHTGERPFGCHCGKQFSRLDNLRQHAQTVHADKQDQNEAMMRHLTSLHASMAAANKAGHARGGRRPNPSPAHSANVVSNVDSSSPTMSLVKQEDLSFKMHQRPGTSMGYEGDHNSLLYHQGATWHIHQPDMDRPESKPGNNHSFRDPGQSFLASPPTAAAAPSHSFLPFTSTFSFGLSDPARGDGRPGSGYSRPPTAGGLADPNSRTLPPLSAVVSASLSTSPQQQQQQSFFPPLSSQHQQQSPQHILPLSTAYTLRRPSTATRPGTAPASASFFSSKSSFYGPGLVPRSELHLSYGRSSSGFNPDMGSTYNPSNYDAEPASPAAGHDSPFYFQPPALVESQSTAALSPNAAGTSSPPSFNPRKRTFAGPDGPHDDAAGYDHGTESRPQSRRLSVLELCNDDGGPSATSGPFLLSHSGPTATNVRTTNNSRPNTSSGGLVSSASALALVDPVSPITTNSSNSPLLPGASASSRSTVTPGEGPGSGAYASAGRSGSPGQEEFRRSQLSASSPQPAAAPASVRFDVSFATPILHHRTGSRGAPAFPNSSAFPSTPSSSPSIGSRSPDGHVSSPSFAARGPVSSPTDAAGTTSSISRRNHGSGDGKHDQVRISVSPHAATALGMRA
ncbi:hypothetical protein AX17_006358 [Amanita inopinata Kibby_2008]|nr:hypothetical protein AX17_006358 [Amanita inopinata Kibby_2008]